MAQNFRVSLAIELRPNSHITIRPQLLPLFITVDLDPLLGANSRNGSQP